MQQKGAHQEYSASCDLADGFAAAGADSGNLTLCDATYEMRASDHAKSTVARIAIV